MSIDWVKDMEEFEFSVVGAYHPPVPTVQPATVRLNRITLVMEEVGELATALSMNNMVEIADAITDSIVVLIGTALTFGIDLRPVWNEVLRSNMSKAGGRYRNDGKLLKPEGYSPPDIETILREQYEKVLEALNET